MNDLVITFGKQFIPEIGDILRGWLGSGNISILCLALVKFFVSQVDISSKVASLIINGIGSTKIPSSPACAWVIPLLLSVTIAIFMLFSFHGYLIRCVPVMLQNYYTPFYLILRGKGSAISADWKMDWKIRLEEK